MKKILAALALAASLSGCVVSPAYVAYDGPYYVGYYNPGYGYWTGYGWDVNFYLYGHPGYGHHYYAPRGWRGGYVHGGYRHH
jgi:hypothetical protein